VPPLHPAAAATFALDLVGVDDACRLLGAVVFPTVPSDEGTVDDDLHAIQTLQRLSQTVEVPAAVRPSKHIEQFCPSEVEAITLLPAAGC